MELGASFQDILARMDSGWQERPGTSVVLEGRGLEWGRDWRIWCANLKQGSRYRGVVVEVPATTILFPAGINIVGSVFTFDEFTRIEIVVDTIC